MGVEIRGAAISIFHANIVLYFTLDSFISKIALSATKIVGYNKSIITPAQGFCSAHEVSVHTCRAGKLSL